MHGTEVASLIAGHGHDTQGYSAIAGQPGKPTGMIGVAPDAKILPISLNMGTTGGKSIDEQIPAAVRYAVDHGAQIINMSIGSNKTSWPQSWDDAFAYAEQKGVLIVAAAGNRGSGLTQVGAPATIPGVLTVGGGYFDCRGCSEHRHDCGGPGQRVHAVVGLFCGGPPGDGRGGAVKAEVPAGVCGSAGPAFDCLSR